MFSKCVFFISECIQFINLALISWKDNARLESNVSMLQSEAPCFAKESTNSFQRRLAISKYVIRSLSVPNSVKGEILMNQDTDYPKRASNISFLLPIKNYTDSLMKDIGIDLTTIPIFPMFPQMPPWEHIAANFDTDYTDVKKNEDPNLLTVDVKSHIESNYANYLKVYTDGSVLESGRNGAAFVIPVFKVQKSFHLGKHFSIFTCELFAILMALNLLSNTGLDIHHILFCVDSKAVLMTLKH